MNKEIIIVEFLMKIDLCSYNSTAWCHKQLIFLNTHVQCRIRCYGDTDSEVIISTIVRDYHWAFLNLAAINNISH